MTKITQVMPIIGAAGTQGLQVAMEVLRGYAGVTPCFLPYEAALFTRRLMSEGVGALPVAIEQRKSGALHSRYPVMVHRFLFDPVHPDTSEQPFSVGKYLATFFDPLAPIRISPAFELFSRGVFECRLQTFRAIFYDALAQEALDTAEIWLRFLSDLCRKSVWRGEKVSFESRDSDIGPEKKLSDLFRANPDILKLLLSLHLGSIPQGEGIYDLSLIQRVYNMMCDRSGGQFLPIQFAHVFALREGVFPQRYGENSPAQVAEALTLAKNLPQPQYGTCMHYAAHLVMQLAIAGISAEQLEIQRVDGELMEFETRWGRRGSFLFHRVVMVNDIVIDRSLPDEGGIPFPEYIKRYLLGGQYLLHFSSIPLSLLPAVNFYAPFYQAVLKQTKGDFERLAWRGYLAAHL